MHFNVIEELYQEVSCPGVSSSPTIKVIYIDNVVDESCYNPTIQSNTAKKETLNRCQTKDEYLNFFRKKLKENYSDLKVVESSLNEITDKMINNFILIKNHVETYSMHFMKEYNPIKLVNYSNLIYF